MTDSLPSESAQIVVIGSGSWGSTLAWLFSTAGKRVRLWTRNEAKAEAIRKTGMVEGPLRVGLPKSVEICCDLPAALSGADIVILACTSQSMREVSGNLAAAWALDASAGKRTILVSAVKGLELHSFKRMSEVLEELLPGFPVCALSGPNLADEILRGLPAASVVASKPPHLYSVQKALSTSRFRLYANTDIVGVELGGSLKNIIAVAAGISDGLNLGDNAKAALLTRGIAEMSRLAVAMGAQSSTLAGLAGMGDLFATCASANSRNHRLGIALAKGQSCEDALRELGAVAEGVPTTHAVCELSQSMKLELPIAQIVEETLEGKTTPERAIMTLMARPLASE
ncbi:MAG TPA: NAD(P)H-dependent glycerol-3-phosphate dehydrogenase [Candidatus Obscuribacterales bacterium]